MASVIARVSSSSSPKYQTVLSIFVWPTATALHQGCPFSCRFASPWFFASNACRLRFPLGRSKSPSHGKFASFGGSRNQSLHETGQARGVRLATARNAQTIVFQNTSNGCFIRLWLEPNNGAYTALNLKWRIKRVADPRFSLQCCSTFEWLLRRTALQHR